MLSEADKVYIGKKSLALAEMLDTIPKEMEEARQLVHEEMLDGYKEQFEEYKQALRYFREVFCVNYSLAEEDVYQFVDSYKVLELTNYLDNYYNQETLSEQDLFGQELK